MRCPATHWKQRKKKKKRVCASVVRFSKLMCCFQTLPQGLRFLCPVEWTIFFLNCKCFNNDGCLLDVVALGFFFIYTMAIIVGELFSFIPCNRSLRKRASFSRRRPTPPSDVSQTSFGGKISADVSKRRLFSQVTAIAEIFFSAS